jgi:hypothetical protein
VAQGTVTFVVTNGPDTITIKRPYSLVVAKAGTPDTATTPDGLADTGSSFRGLTAIALILVGLGFLLLPQRLARRR